jgi:hypothetical protein
LSQCYRPLEDRLEKVETELATLKTLLSVQKSVKTAPTVTVAGKPPPPAVKKQPHRAAKKVPNLASILQYGIPSSPVTPVSAVTPTNDNAELATPAVILGVGPSNPKIVLAQPKFWVYLPGLDPGIDEKDLEESIQTTFESNEIRCVKLLPKGKEQEDCEFISFKIGFPQSMKAEALDPTNWPAGFSVREFQNRQANFRRASKFRTPARHYHQRRRRFQ